MKYSVTKKNGGISIKGHYVEENKRVSEKDIFQNYIENRSQIQAILGESSKILDDMSINEFYLTLQAAYKIKKENIEIQAKLQPFIEFDKGT